MAVTASRLVAVVLERQKRLSACWYSGPAVGASLQLDLRAGCWVQCGRGAGTECRGEGSEQALLIMI